MKHVFIAIGGSGTKAAEALVRLLAVGFPVRNDNGVFTSAGDKLEIWRVDPDKSAGASEELNTCIREYRELQGLLTDGNQTGAAANSHWSMDIEANVRELNPLDLPNMDENQIKSLDGILNSGRAKESSLAMLAPFYERKDLDVKIDRGFYQKPFIGAAVMSVFAQSLENDSVGVGKVAGLTGFHNTPTNFYLCGSLHGGTGACGVPVMAEFLNRRKNANPNWGWRVGGCLLAPFVKPPMPPFQPLNEGDDINEVDIDALVKAHADKPAFQDMPIEDQRELVKQILLGFYADPDDMEARARQGLTFYKDHSADYFDELYIVGKPSPNQLKTWSNGGKTQKNPLNSADVVAAIAALNFFAKSGKKTKNSYIIGSTTYEIPQESMRLSHLPSYKIGSTDIEAEKVFLATALTNHLVLREILWHKIHESAKDFQIAAYYDGRPEQKNIDEQMYQDALELIGAAMQQLVRTHSEMFPTGWSSEDAQQIRKFLGNKNADPNLYGEVREKMTKRFMSKEPKGKNRLGRSEAGFTTIDFGKWCPNGDQFTRGEYLRNIWNEVYKRCGTVSGIN